ncbi:hypothetical protein KBB05_00450 [Patescibacteria group bacterium]|nr:hypothetical protein [Patescibacteria group bacterium]
MYIDTRIGIIFFIYHSLISKKIAIDPLIIIIRNKAKILSLFEFIVDHARKDMMLDIVDVIFESYRIDQSLEVDHREYILYTHRLYTSFCLCFSLFSCIDEYLQGFSFCIVTVTIEK